MLGLFFLSGGRFTLQQHKKDACYVILSGVAMAADWLLLFEAYTRIGISLGMIINYCGPVIVIIGSVVFFSERITGKTILAITAGLLGAVLISWQGIQSGIDRLGLLLAILSAFAYAAMVILNKLSRNIVGTQNAVTQLLSTCVIVLAYVGIRQNLWISIPSGSILPVLWIGVVNTGLGSSAEAATSVLICLTESDRRSYSSSVASTVFRTLAKAYS